MGKTYDVLLVEDEPTFIKKITEAATCYPNYSIIHTTGFYHEALNFIREHRPPVVITDIQLTDESGLSLMRTLRYDQEFKDYNPYITAITSYASPRKHKLIKEVADDLHLKNEFFNAGRIFVELGYAFEFEDLSQYPPIAAAPTNEIESLVAEILEQFHCNPMQMRHRQCVTDIIQLALTTEKSKGVNLTNLYAKVAPTFGFKSSKAVSSLIKRYLDEILVQSDEEILERYFFSCTEPLAPTQKEFFNTLIEEVVESL